MAIRKVSQNGVIALLKKAGHNPRSLYSLSPGYIVSQGGRRVEADPGRVSGLNGNLYTLPNDPESRKARGLAMLREFSEALSGHYEVTEVTDSYGEIHLRIQEVPHVG